MSTCAWHLASLRAQVWRTHNLGKGQARKPPDWRMRRAPQPTRSKASGGRRTPERGSGSRGAADSRHGSRCLRWPRACCTSLELELGRQAHPDAGAPRAHGRRPPSSLAHPASELHPEGNCLFLARSEMLPGEPARPPVSTEKWPTALTLRLRSGRQSQVLLKRHKLLGQSSNLYLKRIFLKVNTYLPCTVFKWNSRVNFYSAMRVSGIQSFHKRQI